MAKTAAARKAATSSSEKAEKPRVIKGRPWIWMQSLSDKDLWTLDHIPAGEVHAPRIKRSSKNDDGTYTYGVTRNGKAIGAPRDFEKAKRMAESGEPDQAALKEMAKVRRYREEHSGDVEEFKKLSAYGQAVVTLETPWHLPNRSAMRGVKTKTKVMRRDQMTATEKKAETLALPMDSKIERLRDGNPKKQGSSAWGRWEVLFAHCDGQTVGEYIKNHGNPTTLQNAVAKGWVRVKGMGGK